MSHKKCPISKVFLESIPGIPLSFFCIVHKSLLCNKFRTLMSKASHLNFSLNTHFFVTNISSANPYTSSCIIFIVVSLTMLFGTSNNPMCHIFLILSYIYIFFSESYISLILFSSHVSSFTVSPAMPSTTSNTSSQMPSVNSSYPNNTTKQHLPWSVNVSTLLPPCCRPLPPLAARCSPLAAQRWCWPLPLDTWSVIRL
jgi:hypothetical protein